MKKIVLLVFLIFHLIVNSQTIITGGSVYGLWTQANSPYIIQNAIMIPADSTLTIQPGVTVEFQGSYRFWVLGKLVAAGALNDTIIFTSSDTTNGWLGVRYDNTTSTEASVFNFCKFSYGKANVSPYQSGGAINFSGTQNATVSNSRFTRCYADIQGGAINGVYNINITNCRFDNNSAGTCGAIACGSNGGGTAVVSNSIFIENYSMGDYGGAIGFWGTQTIHDNVFYKNVSLGSEYSGGAIYCGSSSSLNIYNNKFFNNSSPNYGGGAIYCYSSPIISNNIFVNNQSLMGGAIFCDGSRSVITNNTMMNNSANYGGAIYCMDNANPTISNSILWGNTASISGSQIYLADQGNGPGINYSNVQGGQGAINVASNIFYLGVYVNNINTDPLVVNPSAGSGLNYDGMFSDLSLSGNSPCINAGNPSGTYPATDLVGNPRVYGSIIDIGAYEFQGLGSGINKISENNLANIYPNPAQTNFTIETNVTEKQTLQLFDVNDKLVLTQTIKDKTTVDVSNLSNGIYNLNLLNNNSVVNKKLVIAK